MRKILLARKSNGHYDANALWARPGFQHTVAKCATFETGGISPTFYLFRIVPSIVNTGPLWLTQVYNDAWKNNNQKPDNGQVSKKAARFKRSIQ